MPSTVRTCPIKRGGRVPDEKGFKSQVACHTCGGLDAVIGSQAGKNDRPYSGAMQALLEICPDKCTIHRFPEKRFIVTRAHNFLNLVAAGAWV